MITFKFSKSLLKEVTDEEWAAIEPLVKEPNAIMIFDQKVDSSAFLIAGTCWEKYGLAIMRTYVYHSCQDDPVKIHKGASTTPSRTKCPMCHKKMSSRDTLYDIELLVKVAIELTDQ